ncbi:MAG: aspartate dehydrogenase [Desulfitobacteriaceae bacterium]
MMKIGLIGSGSIGQFLLQEINLKKILPNVTIKSIFDERSELLEFLKEISCKFDCEYVTDKTKFLLSDIDLYVECANPVVAKTYALEILKQGKNMLIVSVGALVDEDFIIQISNLCIENNCQVYIPSGAIGGLDALSAARVLGEIEYVRLITRKPPKALSLKVENDEPVVVFCGTAAEAIAKFPQNINVAISLSLAGIGAKKTSVTIIADPNVKRNVHEIWVKGAFGEMRVQVENFSMPSNPKTSYLAALSTLSILQRIVEPIKFGY